jgi:hypothetical protein
MKPDVKAGPAGYRWKKQWNFFFGSPSGSVNLSGWFGKFYPPGARKTLLLRQSFHQQRENEAESNVPSAFYWNLTFLDFNGRQRVHLFRYRCARPSISVFDNR